jgi:hypothetical protein
LNATAIVAAASTVRNELRLDPIAVPTPITIARYTAVKKAATSAYRTALLMTTSSS